MIAGVRRGLGAASILMLGFAASIIFSAPALASMATLRTADAFGVTHRSAAPLATSFQRHHASQPCPHVSSPATCRAVTFRLLPRGFAEDIPPPPSETLETSQVRLPAEPSAVARPAAPPRRSNCFSVCIRQRAP
jgi:hypothetical protein